MKNKTCHKCGEVLSFQSTYCPACNTRVKVIRGSAAPWKNHMFLITVLALAAVAYVALTVSSESETPRFGAEHGQMAAEAQPDMNEFINSLPTEFEPLVKMGNAVMDQGNYAMAIECYKRAVDLNPEASDVMIDLGTCYHGLGRNEDALFWFNKGLELDPKNMIGRFNKGIVYFTLGDSATAMQWWQDVLKDNPPPELESRIKTLIGHVNPGT